MKKPDPKKIAKQQPRGFVAEWAVTILLLLFGTTTLLQAFVVPTSSMETTIMTGDHLFVDKLAYAPPGTITRHLLPYSEVKRGDIIVFRWPINIREDYVKRVIGMPGDHIKIVNKQVYVNGKPLDEPYARHITDYIDSYRDNFPSRPNTLIYPPAEEMLAKHVVDGEVVVPEGMYFAMGDNRDNSLDSRYWGFVPRENIIGKPLFVYWSYEADTADLTDFTVHHAVDIAIHFFTKTRWSRTFRFVRADRPTALWP
jgi:signal peptidase I